MRECAYSKCTTTLPKNGGRGAPTKFCSPACRKRADYERTIARSAERGMVCTVDGCNAWVYATSLCRNHYRNSRRKPNRKVIKTCDACGGPAIKEARAQRYAGTYCGQLCRDYSRYGALRSSLPREHWGLWFGSASEWTPPFFRNTGSCEWCGEDNSRGLAAAYCSEYCSRRAKKVRRDGREHNAPGRYTWTQVTKLWMAFDKCCAYCGQRTRLSDIDPDHVVALSRGGTNGIGNILPSCRLCNSDKRELSLAEWAADRERRSLPPVRTTWETTDDRYAHLISKDMFERVA